MIEITAEIGPVLGKTPELVAMHAGLECGVIGEKHPDMQMISFGPHVVDVHSPSERLKISSVGPFRVFSKGCWSGFEI